MSAPIVVTALYAPASRAELLPKALASGADAVIVDLEDAVLADRKDAARANALAFLDTLLEPAAPRHDRPPGDTAGPERSAGRGLVDLDQREHAPGSRGAWDGGPLVQVRVNHPRGAYGPRDLAALGAHRAMAAGAVGLRLPKVAGPADVDTALELLDMDAPPPVHCLLESAAGVENAAATAEHPAVAGLALGEADLANELGLRGEDAFGWIRSRIVIAAAAAGLPAPAMAVYTDLADPQGLAASCAKGRALGMFGRTALHPAQLPTIAAAFTPDEHELRRAREVLAAAADAQADGSGAIAMPDGRFIDAPMVDAARRAIQLGERLS